MKNILISACLLGEPCRYDGKTKNKIDLSKFEGKYNFIPICPECMGGLPTPRIPGERVGERVLMTDGTDVTDNFKKGAEAAYAKALAFDAKIAVLKERSPSCGSGEIYDGSFTKTLINGDGVAAEHLKAHGIFVLGESKISELEKNVDKLYLK